MIKLSFVLLISWVLLFGFKLTAEANNSPIPNMAPDLKKDPAPWNISLEKAKPQKPKGYLVLFKTKTTPAKSSLRRSFGVLNHEKIGENILHIKKALPGSFKSFSKNPNVLAIEKNHIIKAHLSKDPMSYRMWSFENRRSRYYTLGPYFDPQIIIENQIPIRLPSKKDADIDLATAWKLERGSSDTIVAVVDTGIDYYHEDLRENIWTNKEDIPENGIDDDKNGYTDDNYGWNFIEQNNETWDDFGHGTHVAGTIGAQTNNSKSIPGINQEVSIMPVRSLGSDGYGSNASINAGVLYAIKNGARVINLSLGGGVPMPILRSIIRKHPEVLFVFSAGNDGNNIKKTKQRTWPCVIREKNTICVASTDAEDNLSNFSNYHKKFVSIAAPGENILSTIPFDQGCPGAPGEKCLSSIVWDNEKTLFEKEWLHGGIGDDWGMERRYFDFFQKVIPTLEDSVSGNYQENSDSWAISSKKTLQTPSPNCTYTGIAEGRTELNKDFLYIDISVDNGITFSEISALTGAMAEDYGLFVFPIKVIQKRIPFNKVSQSFQLRFRLKSDQQVEFEGISFLMNQILCQGSLPNVMTLSGTSMSAPHVSGVAALLFSHRKTAKPSLVKKSILKGSDKLSSLKKKVKSKGRLNAHKALQELRKYKINQ